MIGSFFAKIKIYLIIAVAAYLVGLSNGWFGAIAYVDRSALNTVVDAQRNLSLTIIRDRREFNKFKQDMTTKLQGAKTRYEKQKRSNKAIRDWENAVMPADSYQYYRLRN